MLKITVFNAGQGQCILLDPINNIENVCLIDCCKINDGKDGSSLPKWLEKNKVRDDGYLFYCFCLTNYDEDHFSGISDILKKGHPEYIKFPNNLTHKEIEEKKERTTMALSNTLQLKQKYTRNNSSASDRSFSILGCYLLKKDLDPQYQTTNNLSQMIFIEYKGSVLCVSGDLEKQGWKAMLKKSTAQTLLKATNVFVASHHGRDNGYVKEIFDYCKPEKIIISDGSIQFDTQKDMASTYANHVKAPLEDRKVLTTRKDNHIGIDFHDNGGIEYEPNRSFPY